MTIREFNNKHNKDKDENGEFKRPFWVEHSGGGSDDEEGEDYPFEYLTLNANYYSNGEEFSLLIAEKEYRPSDKFENLRKKLNNLKFFSTVDIPDEVILDFFRMIREDNYNDN